MILLVLLALTSVVAIFLGLMVVGLFEAPWPILLSLLFVGLFGLQRLAARATAGDNSWAAAQAPTSAETEQPEPSEASANDGTTFTYRGVKYRSTTSPPPASDEQPTITEGIYRGQPWRRTSTDASKQPPSSEQPTELRYRGHRVNS